MVVDRKRHILVISQYFYPEQFRINDICREWVRRGYEVTVVTGIPNYPQGRFFDGYSWRKGRREEYEGIHIVRLPIIPRGRNPVMLMLNYLSFVVSGFFWKLFTSVRADSVFIFEVSPMTQALVGVWYAKKYRVPCRIYVQDLWPENVEAVTGVRQKWLLKPLDAMSNYIYKGCETIFATSPSFVKKIEERKAAWTGEKSKVVYWPQYAEAFYHPAEKKPLPDVEEDDSFKIVFTGNVGYAQGLDILPRVAEQLMRRGCSCRFYIIGDGRYAPKLREEIAQRGVGTMFRLLGRKKPEEIPGYLAHFDAAFLSFADNPLFEMTIPAKLQSYMACGMPIIAVAKGETRRVIEEADCGVCFSFEETEELIEYLAAASGKTEQNEKRRKNALAYCRENFAKDELLNQMEQYLK